MQVKINSKLTAIRNVSKITSKWVLMWAGERKPQRTHTVESNQPEKQTYKQAIAESGCSHPAKDVQYMT